MTFQTAFADFSITILRDVYPQLFSVRQDRNSICSLIYLSLIINSGISIHRKYLLFEKYLNILAYYIAYKCYELF